MSPLKPKRALFLCHLRFPQTQFDGTGILYQATADIQNHIATLWATGTLPSLITAVFNRNSQRSRQRILRSTDSKQGVLHRHPPLVCLLRLFLRFRFRLRRVSETSPGALILSDGVERNPALNRSPESLGFHADINYRVVQYLSKNHDGKPWLFG